MEFTDEPLEPFGERILDIAVPTQLSYKTPLVYRIIKELTARDYLPWTGSHRAELCLDEALTNAILHGNDLDPAKKVRVTVCGDDDRWGVIIEDEGEGFGPDQISDPNDPDFLLQESGRGILLMDAYLDELRFNRRGNRVLMVRARQTEPDEVEAMAAVAGIGDELEMSGEELVSVSHESGIQIVTLQATRVDDSNVSDLRETMDTLISKGADIVLDMGRLEYISSVGLSALVAIYKRIRSKNGHLVLGSVQASVTEILESVGFLKVFTIAPDREQAVKAMKKQL